MTTLFFTHPVCIEHDNGDFHPERPQRLEAILKALEAEEFAALGRREAGPIDPVEIERVHTAPYVKMILDSVPADGHVHLDADTAMSPASGEAALRAAGGLCQAIDAVFAGEADNAFAGVRPPGHHAEAGKAMGFCLFNNVAVAALHTRAAHGLRRVAVVDFDVHHGNGTQAFVFDDPDYLYCSTHQWPLYPGTGAPGETGVAGNVVNAVLPPGANGGDFREAFEGRVIPALDAFAPDFLMISAGFDAHEADPLAGLRLATADYGWVTERLLAVAKRHCGGRLMSTLEGGYDLRALGESAAAHVSALMA